MGYAHQQKAFPEKHAIVFGPHTAVQPKQRMGVMENTVKEIIAKQQEFVSKYLGGAGASATTYSYDCQVSIASAGGGYLNVDFKKNGSVFAKFQGGFGGGIGGYTGWGKAWFDKPVEELIGQTAGFTVEVVGILGGTAHVQITNASNFIGNCSTGGVGIGAGVGAGAGKFVTG
jgi:hypothetical protein